MKNIKLNDILKLDNLDNTKIRFNLAFYGNWNPIEKFKNNEMETILNGHIRITARENLIKTDKLQSDLYA